jgi:hypothetical protein
VMPVIEDGHIFGACSVIGGYRYAARDIHGWRASISTAAEASDGRQMTDE